MRTVGLVRIVVGALAFTIGGQLPATAQVVQKDAAYWQTYITTLKPNSTVKVHLNDGASFEGRLIATTAEDMMIRVKRLPFRPRLEQRIRFDAVKSLSRTHPVRNLIIVEVCVVGGTLLLIAALTAGPE
jgi:hypothetical protein